jgi:uncharacterized protein with FMN-binding domain
LGSVFASLSVLTIGWLVGAASMNAAVPTTTATASKPVTTTPNTTSPSTTAPTGTTTAPVAAAPAPTGPADGTYAGTTINTRFGPVQVQVTISGGAIADVTALQLTNADGRSVQISNQVAPIVRQEVLAAQSAHVSNVSGGTYTTQGYLQSLQSALTQAGF